MGLDMHLRKKTPVAKHWLESAKRATVSTDRDFEPKLTVKDIPVDVDKVAYIVENTITWRKANQIHGWFVENVQEGIDDCRTYEVSIDLLEKLLGVCKKVWEVHENMGEYHVAGDLAKTVLPATEGFFFGDTGYSEGYYRDVKDTIDALEPAIQGVKDARAVGWFQWFEYSSSW